MVGCSAPNGAMEKTNVFSHEPIGPRCLGTGIFGVGENHIKSSENSSYLLAFSEPGVENHWNIMCEDSFKFRESSS